MTATSSLRGHPIYRDGGAWRYLDTGEPTAATWQGRACGRCEKPTGADGHDPCVGEMPGVRNACCGHGVVEEAYVQLESGPRLSGAKAVAFFKILEKGARNP